MCTFKVQNTNHFEKLPFCLNPQNGAKETINGKFGRNLVSTGD